METEEPLPALRIAALVEWTTGHGRLTGWYDLVVNWDPQDSSFDHKGVTIKEGEFAKRVYSWSPAYTSALIAIAAIKEPLYRKALLRGLTPIPLHTLNTSVIARPCGEADFWGMTYSWRFLDTESDRFDVVVDETTNTFQGIHDNR